MYERSLYFHYFEYCTMNSNQSEIAFVWDDAGLIYIPALVYPSNQHPQNFESHDRLLSAISFLWIVLFLFGLWVRDRKFKCHLKFNSLVTLILYFVKLFGSS